MNAQDIIQQHKNSGFLKADDMSFIEKLLADGQEQLFSDWSPVGSDLDKKRSLISQLSSVDASYPGGLAAYTANSRRLLAGAREGANPYADFTPTRPDTLDLAEFDDEYDAMEKLGLENADKLAMVMVAGGLGERLGYPGIKIEIAFELLNNTCYMDLYARYIMAWQDRFQDLNGHSCRIPLIIMVSGDTDEPTRKLLTDNSNFGLAEGQVIFIKQELVPALLDNDAHLAKSDPYTLQLKPHGHGDVHMLMHQNGLAGKLITEGKTHLVFIQDTNGQVVNVVLPFLGASISKDFDFNSIGIPRVPKEAIGAISTLKGKERDITINIEYNQLDALLKSTIQPEGDVAAEDGNSPFPGNVNVLCAKLSTYKQILDKSNGIIAEFVNPKYADADKTIFKKPTRLETMMQDLPQLFTSGEKAGVTVFDRKWCFSPNKNRLEDAVQKAEFGQPPESAASAESDFYLTNRKKLELAGTALEKGGDISLKGVPFLDESRVFLAPEFAVSLAEVREKVQDIRLSHQSSLVLRGKDIRISGLTLEGSAALLIDVCDGASLSVEGLTLSDSGMELQETADDAGLPPSLSMRGYQVVWDKPLRVQITEKGRYVLDSSGKVSKK